MIKIILFSGVNGAEDDIECESFKVISIDFLLVSEKEYITCKNI